MIFIAADNDIGFYELFILWMRGKEVPDRGKEVPDTSTNDSPNLAHSQLIFILTRTGKRGKLLYIYLTTLVYTT